MSRSSSQNMHTTKVFTAARHRIRGQAPQEEKHIPPSPTIAVRYADGWWGLPAVPRSNNNWVAKKSNTCGLFWVTMIVSRRGVASLSLSLSRSSSRKSSRNLLVRTHTNFTKLLFFFPPFLVCECDWRQQQLQISLLRLQFCRFQEQSSSNHL